MIESVSKGNNAVGLVAMGNFTAIGVVALGFVNAIALVALGLLNAITPWAWLRSALPTRSVWSPSAV